MGYNNSLCLLTRSLPLGLPSGPTFRLLYLKGTAVLIVVNFVSSDFHRFGSLFSQPLLLVYIVNFCLIRVSIHMHQEDRTPSA